MFSYRSVLNSAWTITKQHKKLWIFGFLAFLLSAGGEYQILTKLLNEDYGAGVYQKMESGSVLMNTAFWLDLCRVCVSSPQTSLGLFLLLILMAIIVLAVLWVCIKSQIALVSWTKVYLNNKNKEKQASVWTEISTPDVNFWPVLGLNISLKILITALFFLLSLPLIFLFFRDSSLAILVYTIFFIIFLPIAISLSLIIKYSIAGVILEKQTFVQAFESGYKLFCKNWLVSLEMAILLFLFNFIIGLLVAFVLSVILLPIMLTLIIFNLVFPLYVITGFSFLLLVTAAAVLMVFQTSAWTILFLELKETGVKAKLERMFNKNKNRKSKK